MAGKNTGFFFDEKCLWHFAGTQVVVLPVGGWVQPAAAGGSAESPETKRRIKSLMDVAGLTDQLTVQSAPLVSQEMLELVHSRAYLERLKGLSDAGGGQLGPYLFVGPGTYEIAKLSAGLAVAAVDAVVSGKLDNAYALSRPPGHHCLPDEGMGFCYLNNIALAIEAAKQRRKLGRVAVVDWDVHHGNGTQHIFYERDDVLTLSIHQDRAFPPGYTGITDRGAGAGQGANINIPLHPGAGHDTYLHALERIILPALARFEPECIIVASGFDANAFDPLSRMLASSETYRLMTRRLKEAANGKLVLVHEGGYSEIYVPFCGLAVMEELSGIKTEVDDPLLDVVNLMQPSHAIENFHRDYVDGLAKSIFG